MKVPPNTHRKATRLLLSPSVCQDQRGLPSLLKALGPATICGEPSKSRSASCTEPPGPPSYGDVKWLIRYRSVPSQLITLLPWMISDLPSPSRSPSTRLGAFVSCTGRLHLRVPSLL